MGRGHETDTQTHKHTDSVNTRPTRPRQEGRVGENIFKLENIKLIMFGSGPLKSLNDSNNLNTFYIMVGTR